MNKPDNISKTRKNEGKTTIESIDRDHKALDLRRAGMTYDIIAKTLGWADPSVAHKAVQRALKRALHESGSEELREVELSRLDRLQAALWPKALEGNLGAADRILRIAERRARLLGLDAPVKQEVEVTAYKGGTDIDREVERLAKTLAALDDGGKDDLDQAAGEGAATPS